MLIDILNTNKTYNIIYADPPWSLKGYDLKKEARYVGNKYDVMSIDEIKNLPIENISCENSILFMWVTYPKLNECFEVIKEWGFEYKTVAFTWVKKNKKSNTNFFWYG